MDTAFFWFSKAAWLLVSPSSLLVLLLLLNWYWLMRERFQRVKWCLSGLTIVVLLLTLLPFGQWLLLPLEQRFSTNPILPTQVDGILVLSGAENASVSQYWQQPELNDAAERLSTFMMLSKRYPQARRVFTGGGYPADVTKLKESDVAKQWLQMQGVDITTVEFEQQARNTAENASLSYAMVKPKVGENWLLITTAWHMPRSIGLFCQVGWPMHPYPVDHRTQPDQPWQAQWAFSRNLSMLDLAVKEWVGLVAYYVSGKTPTVLPEAC